MTQENRWTQCVSFILQQLSDKSEKFRLLALLDLHKYEQNESCWCRKGNKYYSGIEKLLLTSLGSCILTTAEQQLLYESETFADKAYKYGSPLQGRDVAPSGSQVWKSKFYRNVYKFSILAKKWILWLTLYDLLYWVVKTCKGKFGNTNAFKRF